MSSQSAFTFMEILIALCIFAILSLFFIPSLQDITQSADDRMLQTQLIRAIELARRETSATHQPVALKINANELILFVNAQQNGVIEKDSDLLLQQTLHLKQGTLHLRQFPHYQHYLLFLPQGLMANDNATFWYYRSQNAKPAWRLVLSKSGRVSVVTQSLQIT